MELSHNDATLHSPAAKKPKSWQNFYANGEKSVGWSYRTLKVSRASYTSRFLLWSVNW